MKDITSASHTEVKSSKSRYACMAAMVVAFFFLVSLSAGGGDKKGDSLRSGQAKRPTVHGGSEFLPNDENGDSSTGTATSGKDFDDGDEQGMGFTKKEDVDEDAVVEEAENAFRTVVHDQLEKNQDMINLNIEVIMKMIKEGLDGLLGDGDIFESDDLQTLTNTIESKLVEDVRATLKSRTNELLEEKVVDMEDTVDLDTEGEANAGGGDGEDQPVDMKGEEETLKGELRNGVDDICARVKGEIKHRGAVIEKDLLETLLKAKTGKTYKVEIDGNENLVGYKRSSSTSTSSTHKSSHHSSKPKSSSTSSHHKSSSSSHHSTSSGHKSSSAHKPSSHHSSSHHTKKVSEPSESEE